jgi:hypothetical protein
MSAITTVTQVYGAKVSLIDYLTFINSSDAKNDYNKELEDNETTLEEIITFVVYLT